jgi:hypothetical protein
MLFARTDEDGRPIAFYDSEIHGDAIPEDTVEITEESWREALAHPGRRRLSEGGEVVECDPPEAPPVDAEAARAFVDGRLTRDPLVAELVAVIAETSSLTVEEIRGRMLARMGVDSDA